MVSLTVSELPEKTRVKISKEKDRELWRRVNSLGGIREVSRRYGYGSSKLYNWKNKGSFYPVQFLNDIIEEDFETEINSIKGRSNGKPVDNVNFPLEISKELLTRFKLSVYLNREGTPIYSTDERVLAQRFKENLSEIGSTPSETYVRDNRYEVRFPKILADIFSLLDFEHDLVAEADEIGEVENGILKINEREYNLQEIDFKPFSKELRLEIALAKKDKEEIENILKEESKIIDKIRRRDLTY